MIGAATICMQEKEGIIIVNNYYKWGPSTKENVKQEIANHIAPDIPFGKWYVDGNFVDGSPGVSNNNWEGVAMEKGTDMDANQSRLQKAFDAISIQLQSAKDAYISVLEKVGANLPARDTLDERILNNVKNRTGGMIDVQGGFPHGTAYELTVNAGQTLRQPPPPKTPIMTECLMIGKPKMD
jgi:hypothetical protein